MVQVSESPQHVDTSAVEKGIISLLLAVMIYKLIGVFYSFSAQGLSVKRPRELGSEEEDGPTGGTSGYSSDEDEDLHHDEGDEHLDDLDEAEAEEEDAGTDEDWDRSIDSEETRRAYYAAGE